MRLSLSVRSSDLELSKNSTDVSYSIYHVFKICSLNGLRKEDQSLVAT